MSDANGTRTAIVPPEPYRPDYGSRRNSKLDESCDHANTRQRILIAVIAVALLAACCYFIF